MGRRTLVTVTALAVLVVAAALVVGAATLAGWGDDDQAPAGPPTSVGGAAAADADRYRSTVAESLGPGVAVYDRPDGTATRGVDQPTDPPRPLVFLVTEERGAWLEVLLPVRPNGSRGWIRAADVRLTEHDYRIVIELAIHRLTVSKGAGTVLQAPIGVGEAQTPTPGGLYYTKELLRPPDPNTVSGPYAYGLSGFSNVLTSYAGGDGVVGIHGTNDPSGLGRDVSAGCIRMPNSDIRRLVEEVGLPLGVPVEIRP